MYANTKKYKLADLGLSRLSYRVAGEEIVEGDSRYMAPELLQELDEFGNMPDLTKADIFSLGAAIYEIMTGRNLMTAGKELPKNGDEWHQLRSGRVQPELVSTCFSESLKDLIHKMMQASPSQRPSAKEILEKHLLSDEQLENKWLKISIKNMRAKIEEYTSRLLLKRSKSLI